MQNQDQQLLQKQTEHAQNLLQIVKQVTREKQELQLQIASLQKQLDSVLSEYDRLESLSRELAVSNKQKSRFIVPQEQKQRSNDPISERSTSQLQTTLSHSNFPFQDDKLKSSEERYRRLEEQYKLLERKYRDLEMESRSSIQNRDEQIQSQYQMIETLKIKISQLEVVMAGPLEHSTISESQLPDHWMDKSQIAQQSYEKSRIIVQKENLRLIEDFYVISFQDSDIESKTFRSNVVFKHPIDNEAVIPELSNQITQFLHPKINDHQIVVDQKKELFEIFNQTYTAGNFQIIVFTPSKMFGYKINNQFILDSNPDQLLFAFVLYTKDFIAEKMPQSSCQVVQQKKYSHHKQIMHKINSAYVIVSYFPLVYFFWHLLTSMVKEFNQQRLLKYEKLPQTADLQVIDGLYFMGKDQEAMLRKSLNSVIQIPVKPPLPKEIRLFNGSVFQLSQVSAKIQQFECAPINLFQGWDSRKLVDVLAYILSEEKVIINGYSEEQVTYLMLFFNLAMKPFVYCHPFMTTVPEKLQPLFDAPVPVFLGHFGSKISHSECIVVVAQNHQVEIEASPMNSPILRELQKQVEQKLTENSRNTGQIEFLSWLENLINLLQRFCSMVSNDNGKRDTFIQKVQSTQLYHFLKNL